MELGETLHVTTRKEWRSWLSKNRLKKKVIWLIYYKKATGKPRIPYNTAVEEALCYGWIDSTAKNMDEERLAQRFTPRRLGSPISEMNKERVRRLMIKNKMTKAGFDAIAPFFDPEKDKNPKLVVAPDILKAIKANPEAWKNFQNFDVGYKRVRIGYIESQRAHNEIFQKCIKNFVRMTAKNKKFGMVQ